ncbi:unnamed protein product, partial [Heterotrigona itama]
KLVRSKAKFDVCIIELFTTECFLGIVHALSIPIVVEATEQRGSAIDQRHCEQSRNPQLHSETR